MVVDVHHHLVPAGYAQTLRDRGVARAGGGALPAASVQDSLGRMDELGVDTAVLSLSAPGVHVGDGALATRLARETNEAVAGAIADHGSRFRGFASLPVPHVDLALEELAYASDVLQLDGVILLSNVEGVYPGDPSLDPLFAELDRRRAVVFVHPTVPPGEPVPSCVPAPVLEFTFETARAVMSLLVHETVERYPGVRFVVAHAGGAFPAVAGRAATVLAGHPAVPAAWRDRPLLESTRRLYYDTALSTSEPTLAALRTLVGPGSLLFGTDHPFASAAAAAQSLTSLRRAFPPDELALVLGGNARTLLGQQASRG